jgi:very-short-patch-repair endonuclease
VDAQTVGRRLGGVARTQDLRLAGLSTRQIARACAVGEIERLRIGHFADPSASADVKLAHTLGGRPTCLTAARLHGLRTLRDRGLHVEFGLHEAGMRAPQGRAVAHWVTTRSAGVVASPLATVTMAVLCLPALEAICVVDSALQSSLVFKNDLLRELPRNAWQVVELADGRSESVTETAFRIGAQEAGLHPRPQHPLPGGRRADFIVGERLLIELDGAEHHAGTEAFAADRNRDALMAAYGYYVLRFTYDQVINRWEEVLAVLLLVTRRGDHLWPASIRPL